MAYVGTPIDTRNQFQSLQGKRFNGDGSTTDFTLDVAPGSTLDIEVFVGNVRQDPNSAYTLSGTTLSFTGAPPSGTNNIYVVHQAKSVGTIDVPALGVSTASIQADAITEAKIADDAVESEHLNDNIISGQTELAATPADTDELIISDAGTLKRIDFSHIKGGFTKIHSITASDDATVIFDNTYVTTAYKTYLVTFSGIVAATDSVEWQLHVSGDNGSNTLGAGGNSRVSVQMEDDDSSLTFENADEAATAWTIGRSEQGNANYEAGGGYIWIFGSQDTSSWIMGNSSYTSWGSSMELTWEDAAFGTRSTTNANHFKFKFSSGNIETGVVTLYGAN